MIKKYPEVLKDHKLKEDPELVMQKSKYFNCNDCQNTFVFDTSNGDNKHEWLLLGVYNESSATKVHELVDNMFEVYKQRGAEKLT